MRLLILSRKLKAYLVPVVAYGIILLAATQTLAQDFVVVVNKDLGTSEVTSEEMEQMLLGKKSKWPSGETVSFVLFDDRDTLAAFLKEYVNKSPIQFKSYWKRLVFTGKGRMPKYFKSKEDVAAFVNDHSGSFGFLPAPGNNSVKTLVIK